MEHDNQEACSQGLRSLPKVNYKNLEKYGKANPQQLCHPMKLKKPLSKPKTKAKAKTQKPKPKQKSKQIEQLEERMMKIEGDVAELQRSQLKIEEI